MPKAARITSMSVLGVKADGTVDLGSTEAEATLYYGEATRILNSMETKLSRRKEIYLLLEGVA